MKSYRLWNSWIIFHLNHLLSKNVNDPFELLNKMNSSRNIAISLIPSKEDVINKIWLKTLILLLLYRKKPELLKSCKSNHAFVPKNTWISLLLKIYIYDDLKDNTLPSSLFQILLLESNFDRPFYVSPSTVKQNTVLMLEINETPIETKFPELFVYYDDYNSEPIKFPRTRFILRKFLKMITHLTSYLRF